MPLNKQIRAQYLRTWRLKLKNAAYALLGEICASCAFADRRALQIDHVFGDGFLRNKINGVGRGDSSSVYQEVLKEPERFQILCANCNWIKRVQNQEHKKRERYSLWQKQQ